jgi:hypothetical protein
LCAIGEKFFPDGEARVAVIERLLERSDFDEMIATLAWVKINVPSPFARTVD